MPIIILTNSADKTIKIVCRFKELLFSGEIPSSGCLRPSCRRREKNRFFDVLYEMLKSTIRARMEKPDQKGAIVGRQPFAADQGFRAQKDSNAACRHRDADLLFPRYHTIKSIRNIEESNISVDWLHELLTNERMITLHLPPRRTFPAVLFPHPQKRIRSHRSETKSQPRRCSSGRPVGR